MFKIISYFIISFFSLTLFAQTEKGLKLYDQMSDPLQQVFCDYTNRYGEIKYLSSNNGQYIGQLIDNNIYGWGYYLADNGNQMFGQFRNGHQMFGILLSAYTARVGSDVNFVEYELSTGKILRIETSSGKKKFTDEQSALYLFKKITYENGDVYYGELLNDKRHGYGVYYWANGDFWYGRYENGYRQGFGALFKSDRRMFSGKWIGDNKIE